MMSRLRSLADGLVTSLVFGRGGGDGESVRQRVPLLERLADHLAGLSLGDKATGWPETPPLVFRGGNCLVTCSLNWVAIRGDDDGGKLVIGRRHFPRVRRLCAKALSVSARATEWRDRRVPVTVTGTSDGGLVNSCELSVTQLFELREWLDYAGRRRPGPFRNRAWLGQPYLEYARGRAARLRCRGVEAGIVLDRDSRRRLAAQFRAALAGVESHETYGSCTVELTEFCGSMVFTLHGSVGDRMSDNVLATSLIGLVAALETEN